jgi:hypothetical protein
MVSKASFDGSAHSEYTHATPGTLLVGTGTVFVHVFLPAVFGVVPHRAVVGHFDKSTDTACPLTDVDVKCPPWQIGASPTGHSMRFFPSVKALFTRTPKAVLLSDDVLLAKSHGCTSGVTCPTQRLDGIFSLQSITKSAVRGKSDSSEPKLAVVALVRVAGATA